LAVDSLAGKLKAEGKDVIGFGTGEPDFDTPESIKDTAVRAIHAGKTKYTPAAGLMELRKAAAFRLLKDTGVEYSPQEIVTASGAKHVLFIVLTTLLNPGDEVILPAPFWVTYDEAIKMALGVPVIIKADEKHDFKITPEQLSSAITEKTKAVIINNPSNPTGMLYNRRELEALCEICVRNDVYIIADEIYYRLVYDGSEFTSVASLGEEVKKRTIIVSGVSKSYAMTGWRLGFSASNAEIAGVMTNYLSHSTSAPSTITQYASIEALTGEQYTVDKMRDVFEQRRDYIVRRVNSIPGLSCIKPQGAFYIMLNLKELFGRTIGGMEIHNADDFTLALIERECVALVSCTGFGDPGFARMTYAASMEDITKGLDRIERFLS
jgi:aspartate aminotransferase